MNDQIFDAETFAAVKRIVVVVLGLRFYEHGFFPHIVEELPVFGLLRRGAGQDLRVERVELRILVLTLL